MKTYPSSVSRTLNPSGLGLTTVVGQHDRKLSDADINLIQDLQDLKRQALQAFTTPSGCLQTAPFLFNTSVENQFEIPAFSVLFRGEVLTIGGNLMADPTANLVRLPPPIKWNSGQLGDPATIYVVYLELWAKALDPITGTGFYLDASGNKYFYPWGCANPNPAALTLFPSDVLDPNTYLTSNPQLGETTARAQLQWVIQVAPLPLSYDFASLRAGLDPPSLTEPQVYGQGASTSAEGDWPFQSMVDPTVPGRTGEPCIWRAGNGNSANSLQTLDGYTYAMPLAVVFQRNTGIFDQSSNPFGCASSSNGPASGLFNSNDSGRVDNKYADIVYPEDVVDTRLSVSLTGYDTEVLADQGMTDILTGSVSSHISRGEATGCPVQALGSLLPYTILIGPASQSASNIDRRGSFDGFFTAFSGDARSYTSVRLIAPGQASTPNPDGKWGFGDTFVIDLDAAGVVAGATITNILVQGFANILNTDGTPTQVLVSLYGGQIDLSWPNSNYRKALATISVDLVALGYDLGSNPLVVSTTVSYPAGLGLDTLKVPLRIDGGSLADPANPRILPVLGVSEYAIKASPQPKTTGVSGLDVYNPLYSSTTFGTRVRLTLANAGTAQDTGNSTWAMSVPRGVLDGQLLDGRFMGAYPVSALDDQGLPLKLTDIRITDTTVKVVFAGQCPTSGTTTLTMLCYNTAQVAYNPSVKGITAIEEVVVVGNKVSFVTNIVPSTPFNSLIPDARLKVSPVTYDSANKRSTFMVYGDGAKLKGFSGQDNGQAIVWVYQGTDQSFTPYPALVEFYEGVALIQPTQQVDLRGQQWFLFASVAPVLPASASLRLQMTYLPYQGEGVEGRSYTVLYTPKEALVTTNGTGAAPVVGLHDVYPFNREYPIAAALPRLTHWSDSDLRNTPLIGSVDSNFVGKQFQNVEHTFSVKLFTNDFIAPLQGNQRKKIKLLTVNGRRGFTKALPHVGFAIPLPQTPSAIGNNLQATTGPATIFVNNVTGSDIADGMTLDTAKYSVKAALDSIPPVIRFPVSIVLVDTGKAFTLADFAVGLFEQALVGDGQTRAATYYSLGSIAFSMQESARITIGRATKTGDRIVIDGGNVVGNSAMPFAASNPVMAFFVANSRVIFNGIQFKGFQGAAVMASNSDVEFLDCSLAENVLGVSADQNSIITFNGGEVRLGDGCLGADVTQSGVTVDGTILTVTGGTPSAFFQIELNSSMNLMNHNGLLASTGSENGIVASTLVAVAKTNSVIVSHPTWVSQGSVKLSANSTLERSTAINPFQGGIVADPSSCIVADL